MVRRRLPKLQTSQAEAIYKQTLEKAKLTRQADIQAGKERLSKKLNEAKTGQADGHKQVRWASRLALLKNKTQGCGQQALLDWSG